MGEWINLHYNVTFKGKKPLLYQYSILNCKAGGILIASETVEGATHISDSMNNNVWGELGIHLLSQAVYGFATGLTTPPEGKLFAVYNAVAGAGVYSISENTTTEGGVIANGVKIIGPDKTVGLISASSKNLYGRAFAKEFFMGASGFLAGAGVTVATTFVDYFVTTVTEKL